MSSAIHGKDFVLTIGGTTIDTSLDSCTISADRDVAETTAAGDDTGKTFVGGDYTATWSIGGATDFTNATGCDDILWTNFDGGADSWVFMPDDGGVGANNPSYTQNAIITNITITASIGDACRTTATAQGTGAVTRAEA